MNSEGGDLLIGIDDDSNALGLAEDLNTLDKPNPDGFELHLFGLIRKYIGSEYGGHVKITFPHYDNKQICRVQVSRSGKPVFTSYEGRDEFFVRAGCSSQPLSRGEQSIYEREHWYEFVLKSANKMKSATFKPFSPARRGQEFSDRRGIRVSR